MDQDDAGVEEIGCCAQGTAGAQAMSPVDGVVCTHVHQGSGQGRVTRPMRSAHGFIITVN